MFIVIDEDVVPCNGAHVKGVKRIKYPEERDKNEGGKENMKSSVQSTAARGTFLQICFFLNGSKPVSVHLQMNVKAFSFVLAVLDGSCDGQEAAVTDRGMLTNEVGSFMTVRVIIVLQRHRHSVPSNGLLLQF